MKNFFVLLAACGLALPAGAGIAVVLEGPPAFNGTDFTWSYQANLNGGEGIGFLGTQSFFTVYDFAGLDSVGALSAGWTATEQLVGVTPGTQSGIADDPNLLNITFYYNGPSIDGPVIPVLDFTLYSSINALNAAGVFAYQTNGEDQNGAYPLVDQGQGQITVPLAAPEPQPLALLGAGLIALALLRRRV